jgi:16S rRNA G966 N2-methylase RsmD
MILYSGEEANAELAPFVESHLRERRGNPTVDRYDAPEFNRPIKTTKNSSIYSMHPYHLGKKPLDAVAAYVRHYTSEGDLVLDPFCGSGVTALAAALLGRKAAAIDASPAATFITRFYLAPTDPEDLERRFEKMLRQVEDETKRLYTTICHRCGGQATIHYVIYSNVYTCPGCGLNVSFFEASALDPSVCPSCLLDKNVWTRISPSLDIVGYRPAAVNFSCRDKCVSRRMTRSINGPEIDRRAFVEIDLPQIDKIEEEPIPHAYPSHFMMNVEQPDRPWGDEWRPSRNFRRVQDLFTRRNLRALAALFHAAGDDLDLRAVLTSSVWAVSRKAQHLNGGGGYIPGNWALPPMSKQRNVLETVRKVFAKVLKAKRQIASALTDPAACISTQSAASMEMIPSNSVDYIFTDPPYGGAVQYAELNFVWEAWLGFGSAWHEHEIIVNRARGRSVEDWALMMARAMSECFRVLRPGRWLSLCYHAGSRGTWSHIQDIMADAGFAAGDAGEAVTIDTGASTYNQRVADKPVKRDLVINFRKPASAPKSEMKAVRRQGGTPFADFACEVITNFLAANPGAEKDRIYDHLVSVAIRNGVMENHDFEKLLRKVARSDGQRRSRWFLCK